MVRKITAIFVCAVMLFGLVPNSAFAGSSYYINENFDKYIVSGVPHSPGFSGAVEDGCIESSPSAEGWGNCMKMICTSGENPYINIRVPGTPAKATLSFNIMFAGGDGSRYVRIRDNKNKLFTLFNTIGKDIYVCDQKVTELQRIKYYSLSFDINMKDGTCVLYSDGEKLFDGNLPEGAGSALAGVKLEQHGDGSRSTIFVDNIFIYNGKAPDVVKKAVPEKFTPEVKKVLKDSVAWFNNTNVLHIGESRQKISEDKKVIACIQNGTALIPAVSALDALGVEYEENGDFVNATYSGKRITLDADGDEKSSEGKLKLLKPDDVKNDLWYVSAKALAEALGLSYFEDPHGLILISKKDFSKELDSSAELVTELVRTVCYDRPSGQNIIDDYVAAGMSEKHPVLLVGEGGFEKIRNRIETNAEFRSWFEQVRKNTDKILEREPIVHRRSDGRRLDDAQNMYTKYLTPVVLMYNLTGDEKYAEWAWENLEVLCSDQYPEWGQASAEHLNVAELSSAVSIAYDWLYDWLGSERREIVKNALIEKGVKVGLQFHREKKWWLETVWNWNMSLAGGLSLASMTMMAEEPFLCSQLMSSAVKSAEMSLSSFYPDGAWAEGLGYWGYTILNLSALVSNADIILKNDYGIFNSPGLSLTAYMPLHYRGPAGNFNFHDTGSESHTPILGFFAKKIESPGLMYQLYKNIQEESPQFSDLIWFDPDYMDSGSMDVPLDMYYQNVDTMFMKQDLTNSSIYTGLHAGSNDVGHAHMDSGNFIIDANGERWIIDPGKDHLSYSTTPGKENVWAIRTESHNCIVINPDKSAGQIEESYSPIIEYQIKDKGAYAIADLTDAYTANINKYHRGLMLTDNRRAVIVRDEISSDVANDIRWSVTTTAPIVTVSPDGRSAILKRNNKSFYMKIIDGDGVFEVKDANPLETSPNPEGQIPRTTMKQIEIWQKDVKNMSLSVAFIPLSGTDTEPENIPSALALSAWKDSIPDGKILTPELSDIKIDGESISDFKPETKDYIVRLGAEDAIPEVTAAGEDVDIEIIYGGEHIITANIFVTSKEDKTMKCVYQVAFYREAQEVELSKDDKLVVKAVTVSSEPQSENCASNVIDSNTSTRWSAENEQWVMLELEEVVDIRVINLSTYRGDSRSQLFDIEISEDGETWTSVYKGATSGKSDELESFKFEPVKGKFVRINCHGTDSGSWNSITEIEIYK